MGPADNDEDRSDLAAPQQPRHPAASDEEPRSLERRRALDRMVEIAEQAGMYDQTALPMRTRGPPLDNQRIEMQPSPTEAASYVGGLSSEPEPSAPSQAQIEAAVEQTLVGGGAELDVGQKFWWMDWNRMIRDAITARRTGEPVLYDDDEGRCTICLKAGVVLQTDRRSRQNF